MSADNSSQQDHGGASHPASRDPGDIRRRKSRRTAPPANNPTCRAGARSLRGTNDVYGRHESRHRRTDLRRAGTAADSPYSTSLRQQTLKRQQLGDAENATYQSWLRVDEWHLWRRPAPTVLRAYRRRKLLVVLAGVPAGLETGLGCLLL